MFGLTYIKNVSTIRLNREKCTGCGMCLEVCPHKVFSMIDKKAAIIDLNLCMECGACEKNCPYDAIYVKSGVGCASGIINGIINKTEPTCGCENNSGSTSCC